MDDYIQLFGLLSVPIGIMLMCFALVWQLHVMLSETSELNRYKDKELAKVVAWLFFTFSLAVYWFCPKARRKGIIFASTLILGLFLYLFSTQYIFKVLYPPKEAPKEPTDQMALVVPDAAKAATLALPLHLEA